MNKLINFIVKRNYTVIDLYMVGIFIALLHSKQYIAYGVVLIVYILLSLYLENINSKTKEE